MQQTQSFADPEALMRRVSDMIEAGRFGVARPLLAAVRRLSAPAPAIAQLAARIALGEGRFEEARAELDRALAASPEDGGLRKRRAELRLRLGDPRGAAEDAAEAVVGQPDDPVAKALLGTALIGLGQLEDAAACLREAVRARPSEAAYRQALAAAYQALGDAEAAAETQEEGIVACPGSVVLRNAAVLHRVRQHQFEAAVALGEQARLDGVADGCLFGLVGHALSSLGRHDAAAAAYADAFKLAPEDPYIRHLVAASGTLPGSPRAPADYVRAVFDGYAERFDAHLLALGYRVPGLLRNALLRCAPGLAHGEELGPVLDLGCGTGLAAVAVSDLPLRPITGVDLSAGMLRQAEARQLYAELWKTDLLSALHENGRAWRVILAADVLCYFGSLIEVFEAVHRRLAPGGLFLFSVETHQAADEWTLQAQGRYAHGRAYVERAAVQAGFLPREAHAEILRRETDEPVRGLILVLERGA